MALILGTDIVTTWNQRPLFSSWVAKGICLSFGIRVLRRMNKLTVSGGNNRNKKGNNLWKNWNRKSKSKVCFWAERHGYEGVSSCTVQVWSDLPHVRGQRRLFWPTQANIGLPESLVAAAQSLNCVWLFAAPWAVACQAPLSMGFLRQEYWSGLPFPTPGNLPAPGIKPTSLVSPALQASFLWLLPPGKPQYSGSDL